MGDKIRVLEKKYDDMKKVCALRKEKNSQLEQLLGREKENQSSAANSPNEMKKLEEEILTLKKQLAECEESCTKWKQLYYSKNALSGNNHNSDKKPQTHAVIQTDLDLKELDQMSQELEIIKKKYDQAKKPNYIRNEDVAALKVQNENLSKELELIGEKYTRAKLLCQGRNEELKLWRSGEKTPKPKEEPEPKQEKE